MLQIKQNEFKDLEADIQVVELLDRDLINSIPNNKDALESTLSVLNVRRSE